MSNTQVLKDLVSSQHPAAKLAKRVLSRPADAITRGLITSGFDMVTYDGYKFRVPVDFDV